MNNTKDNLGERMKKFYEERGRYYLTRRTPVAIRLDMRAGHTFTKGFTKPFDSAFRNSMERTALYLCKNISNVKCAYCQSDEITLILTDYDTLTTDAWFDYRVDKLCSVTASMATMYFNKLFAEEAEEYHCEIEDWKKVFSDGGKAETIDQAHYRALDRGAMFDARCFNVPKEEVANLIVWRWMDAKRNSIQMVGQANFSHTELQGKTCADIVEMLNTREEVDAPWDYYSDVFRFGSLIVKFYDVWNCFAAPDNYEELRNMVNREIDYEEKQTSKNTVPYEIRCPHGYVYCINDPGYIEFYHPDWYADLFKEGIVTCEGYCDHGERYDSEDK